MVLLGGIRNTRDPIFDPSASPYEGMGSNPISLTDVLGLNPGGGGSASGRSSGSSQSTGKEINVYADRIVDSPRPAESAAPELRPGSSFEDTPTIYGSVVRDPRVFGDDLFFNQRNKYHDNGDGTGSMIRPIKGGDLALGTYDSRTNLWTIRVPVYYSRAERNAQLNQQLALRMKVLDESLDRITYGAVGLILAPLAIAAAVEVTPALIGIGSSLFNRGLSWLTPAGAGGALSNPDVRNKLADGVGRGVTVIGETMKRVTELAAKVPGSVTLSNMPKFAGTDYQITSQMIAYNRLWLLEQMKSGRPILDLGLDPTRVIPSIFYQMERNMIANYLKIHPGAFELIKP